MSNSSEINFILINSFAALCYDIIGWPNSLKKLNYKIEVYEETFFNKKNESVKPELVLFSDKENHSILLECKSGTVDKKQLENYSNIEPENVIRGAQLNLEDQDNFKFDLIYYCSQDNLATVLKSITECKSSFPVVSLNISKSNALIKKQLNKFTNNNLDNLFFKGINCPSPYPPQSIIPIMSDKDFPEGLYLTLIFPQLIEYFRKKVNHFNSTQLLTDSIDEGLFNLFGRLERESMRDRTDKVMRYLVSNYIHKYVNLRDGKTPKVYDIIYNPENEKPQKRTQGYKKLIEIGKRAMKEFKQKTGGSTYFQPYIDEAIITNK